MKLLRNLGFMLIGIFFGIVLIKAEVVSWWRIQEMFHFQSFHMYGIIGSAVIVGALSVILLKALKAKSSTGEVIDPQGKPFNKVGNFSGGTIFGLGWALTGACPGPSTPSSGAEFGPLASLLLEHSWGPLPTAS
jgi:uncharacterized membrane protein YedE/YeeE